MPKKQRCSKYVSNRRCKRNVVVGNDRCYQHKNEIVIDNTIDDTNKCCFCEEECNLHSQSCGRCARMLSLFI